MCQSPPLILGAGPAGSAAAIALAQAGAPPLLIDRSAVPGDALCGGFLSWATIARIEALGVSAIALGGHRVTQLGLFSEGQEVRVALPAPGMGLSRHRLDRLLRQAAVDAGAQVRVATARSLSPAALMLDTGEEMGWDSLFLATGKHDVRGLARPRGGADPELGLRFRLGPGAALAKLVGDRIELHMVDRGYVGINLQEDGRANFCLAVRKSALARAGGSPLALVRALADRSPALADRLGDLPDDLRVDAIGDVPYGWRARATWPGLYRLGDQAAVIPSLAGEGMGLAIASAGLASVRWLAAGAVGAQAYQHEFARRAARPLEAAAGLCWLGRHPHLLRALVRMPGAAGLAMRLTRMATT